jgi:ferredoxin
MDAVIAAIVGLEPFDILVTKEASRMGLGEADLGKIEIAGDNIGGFIAADFKLPQTTALKLIPKSMMNGIAGLIKFKPYIDIDICTRCNLCKITCPVSAIEIERDRCKIDYKKCIRCMCCHEVCPYKAISIKRNILTKLVWG